jgi:ATP adenylyltransferase
MNFLSAPWRWSFISKISCKKQCLFCEALKLEDSDSLLCYRGENCFVILNKFPYNTGHIMIVPYEHIASPDKIDNNALYEMWGLINKSLKILKDKFKPDGFNIGMNIGKAAGAGVKDHFHIHIVPRWDGDANFMAVTGNTKVVSYEINNVYDILREEFNKG